MTPCILVRRTGWVVAALACWWLAGGTASAQAPGVVTLDQAVRSTMERTPDVLSAREEIALRQGRVRETAGLFNMQVRFGTSLEHRDQHISERSWFQEWRRRYQLEQTHNALEQVRTELYASLRNGKSARPICPPGASFIRRSTNPTEVGRPICVPVTSDPLALDYSISENSYFEASSLFLPPPSTGFDPQSAHEFTRRYAEIYGKIDGKSVPDFAEDQRQRGFEELENVYRFALEYEQLTALWRNRLGDFPTDEIDNILSLSGDIVKPFRSGGALSFSAIVDGTESRYKDKSFDPDFGGKEANSRFDGKLEVLFNQPLMRGRGAGTVRAPELSAARGLEAARFSYVHSLSRSVLDTTLRYLDVVAAQQTLALLEEELITQRRMLDATMRLGAAGALARVDATRMQARVAEVETSIVQARQQLVAARAALAQSAGLTAQEIGGDVRPGEALPDAPAPVDAEGLLRAGIGNRYDIRAAEASRESARILLAAASADLRPRLDMELHAGYASGYYGSFFRILRDEYPYNRWHCTANWADTTAPCFEPSDSALNFYNLAGVWRAWRDRHWEPEAGIKFTFELPFGNNRAHGRFARSQAAVHEAEVRLTDLGRVTQENTARQAAVLQKARDEWMRRQDAVAQYTTTWADTETRRQAGDMTLIDTLKTEQDLTSAKLQLVRAKRDYSAALAQLRFETGTLVTMRDNRPEADLSGLVTGR